MLNLHSHSRADLSRNHKVIEELTAMVEAVTLRDLRCATCAFREGTEANKQDTTRIKARLCAETLEPFLCHEREGLCAGFAELVNALHEKGFHDSQPEWKKELKLLLTESICKAESGESVDLEQVVREFLAKPEPKKEFPLPCHGANQAHDAGRETFPGQFEGEEI